MKNIKRSQTTSPKLQGIGNFSAVWSLPLLLLFLLGSCGQGQPEQHQQGAPHPGENTAQPANERQPALVDTPPTTQPSANDTDSTQKNLQTADLPPMLADSSQLQFAEVENLMESLLQATWEADTAAFEAMLPTLEELQMALEDSDLNPSEQTQRMANYRTAYKVFRRAALASFTRTHQQLQRVYDRGQDPYPTDTAHYYLREINDLQYAVKIELPLVKPVEGQPPMKFQLMKSLRTRRGFFGGSIKLTTGLSTD